MVVVQTSELDRLLRVYKADDSLVSLQDEIAIKQEFEQSWKTGSPKFGIELPVARLAVVAGVEKVKKGCRFGGDPAFRGREQAIQESRVPSIIENDVADIGYGPLDLIERRGPQ